MARQRPEPRTTSALPHRRRRRRPVSLLAAAAATTTNALLLLLLLLQVSSLPSAVKASPYPRNDIYHAGYSYLALLGRRNCASYCGADNQFCCAANEVCTTMMPSNVATCVAGSYGGALTTTWTETRTYTSTIMTHWVPAPSPTPGVDCRPQSPEQEQCGPICCAGWQTCAYKGQCVPRPGYQEPSTVVVTSNGVVATRYSAPYRVTGTTTIVNSGVPTNPAGGAPTPTSTSTTDGDAVGPDGSSNRSTGGGLSPGAIAGIVIGTLLGLALLILLCFCCIARGIWAAVFGRRKRHHTTEKIVVEEERYDAHRRAGFAAATVPRRPPLVARATRSRRTGSGGWAWPAPPLACSPCSTGARSRPAVRHRPRRATAPIYTRTPTTRAQPVC
ncbi:hypothetical protein AAL_04271 [Moelleriella libera RCEF 2490]|uniref:Uncharacterized protein n=1 Tax=Moelleriella libera RCEF 2490 TaxID=1081109 RepID=A0A168C055_9HYPO|nr:hypothetical protein AAL_04271 [Moelleriella libera RCEF 2490]